MRAGRLRRSGLLRGAGAPLLCTRDLAVCAPAVRATGSGTESGLSLSALGAGITDFRWFSCRWAGSEPLPPGTPTPIPQSALRSGCWGRYTSALMRGWVARVAPAPGGGLSAIRSPVIRSLDRSLFRSSLLLGLLLLGGCATQQEVDDAIAQNENLRAQLDAARDELDRRQKRIDELEAELRRLAQGGEPDWLAEARRLADRMREGTPAPDGFKGEQTPEGLLFSNDENLVLFETASTTITPAGDAALRRLADSLRSLPNKIEVAGHTDNQPIRAGGKWPSNLDLSVDRALAVAQVLIAAGLPAERVSVAGFGEHAPRASNDSPEGMSKNRRTEILVKIDR